MCRFFLSTDNRNTQELYLKKYPRNIIVYKKINKLKNSFRHTTLFDTGIDMCLLTYCNYIEGSFHSSFSRVAVMLNLFRRKEFQKAIFRFFKLQHVVMNSYTHL